MIIRTGTPETRTEHSKALAAVGVGLAVGTPALLTIGGHAAAGWGGIAWVGAIIWGLVATAVMTAMDRVSRAEGFTRMDLPDMLGSLLAEPRTARSRRTGMVLHGVNGVLLAVGWAYTMALLHWPTTWVTGMVWGRSSRCSPFCWSRRSARSTRRCEPASSPTPAWRGRILDR